MTTEYLCGYSLVWGGMPGVCERMLVCEILLKSLAQLQIYNVYLLAMTPKKRWNVIKQTSAGLAYGELQCLFICLSCILNCWTFCYLIQLYWLTGHKTPSYCYQPLHDSAWFLGQGPQWGFKASLNASLSQGHSEFFSCSRKPLSLGLGHGEGSDPIQTSCPCCLHYQSFHLSNWVWWWTILREHVVWKVCGVIVTTEVMVRVHTVNEWVDILYFLTGWTRLPSLVC